MYRFTILFYLLLVVVKSIVCRDIGSACELSITKEVGTCVLLQNCPSAIQALKSNGQHPQICGFQQFDPIVCCVERNVQVRLESEVFSSASITTPTTTATTTTTTTTTTTEAPKVLSRCEKKCQEYSKYLPKGVSPVPHSTNSASTPAAPACKIDEPNEIGTSPPPEKYPHLALIGFVAKDNTTEWLCSGSLISEDYVLTAAHCVRSRVGPAKYIRLGDARGLYSRIDLNHGRDFAILRSIVHPEYKYPSAYNDIALLQMSTKASLSDRIRPICLPANQGIAQTADSASWSGPDRTWTQHGRHITQYKVDYASEKQCNDAFAEIGRVKIKNGLSEKQICAQRDSSSKDICDETTGGPLQILNEAVGCTYRIIGISSFGRECVEPLLQVYTKVSAYTKWIEDIVFGSE